MKQYQRFIFDSYSVNAAEGIIELNYSLDDEVAFTEKIILPSPLIHLQTTNYKLQTALFALHLIGGISYYKTCLPKTIEIRSGSLNESEAEFWRTVYEKGLGEFFYKNDIDFRNLIKFPSTPHPPSPVEKGEPRGKRRVFVPIGGGKDSIVTLELLRTAGYECTLFRMGSHPFITKLAHTANAPLVTVERKLPGILFDLNEQGALNGHVPVTAYLSVLSIVMSLLYDFDAVAMSNERSADEGNIEEFHGMQINHQWSKSLEFERSFQTYLAESIGTDVTYFSPLRPLSELHIAKLFSTYPQYFDGTTSCNANWRIVKERPKERWCGHCPKCAFSFALFSAFLPKETLLKMFNKNLFEDDALLPLYKQLLGIEGFKPFECVGTPDETKAALILAHRREEFEGTVIMDIFEKEVLPTIKNPDQLIEEVLKPSHEHVIPEEFSKVESLF